MSEQTKQDAVEVVAKRLYALIAGEHGAVEDATPWDKLPDHTRDWLRDEARELLADAAAHGTW